MNAIFFNQGNLCYSLHWVGIFMNTTKEKNSRLSMWWNGIHVAFDDLPTFFLLDFARSIAT